MKSEGKRKARQSFPNPEGVASLRAMKLAQRRRGAEIRNKRPYSFRPLRELPASAYFTGSAPFGTAKTRGRRSATGGSVGNFACGSV